MVCRAMLLDRLQRAATRWRSASPSRAHPCVKNGPCMIAALAGGQLAAGEARGVFTRRLSITPPLKSPGAADGRVVTHMVRSGRRRA